MSYIKAYLTSLYKIGSLLSLFYVIGCLFAGNGWSFYIGYVSLCSALVGPVAVSLGLE